MDDVPGIRQEVFVRFLGVYARFESMPDKWDLGLLEGQRVAGRHLELPLHQIQAGDHLGYRVFYLETSVPGQAGKVRSLVRMSVRRPDSHISMK